MTLRLTLSEDCEKLEDLRSPAALVEQIEELGESGSESGTLIIVPGMWAEKYCGAEYSLALTVIRSMSRVDLTVISDSAKLREVSSSLAAAFFDVGQELYNGLLARLLDSPEVALWKNLLSEDMARLALALARDARDEAHTAWLRDRKAAHE